MFVVIFEVQPRRERWNDYLDLAKSLRPDLERIDGFIDNERFASRRTEGRLLSLSTCRDEKAVIRWRTLAVHHRAQQKGRFEVFADYHLRVGEVTADSRLPHGQRLQQLRLDETETGDAKSATITELSPPHGSGLADDPGPELGLAPVGTQGLLDREIYESIYNTGKLLLLASWRNASAAQVWVPRSLSQGDVRHRQVRIVRDYGMHDRREAPQYYPEVRS
jgi:heme-degrading monooxygenase HmoA